MPKTLLEWNLFEVQAWVAAVEQRGLKVQNLAADMQPQVEQYRKMRDAVGMEKLADASAG